MLQITPEDEKKPDTDEAIDDAIYCAGCGHLITRGRWRTAVDGHGHVFFNPAGRVFRILLFSEAPGIACQGEPTDEFTWFKGYDWVYALCRGCGAHMGWRFTGVDRPPLFFGLGPVEIHCELMRAAAA